MSFTTSKKSTGTLHSIQWIRGIAALLVVMHHMLLFFRDIGIKTQTFDFGAIGVDIFFVISGFIMVYITRDHDGSLESSASFFRKRLFRVMPIYWLVTLVYLSSNTLANSNNVTQEIILKSFFLIPSYYIIDGMIAPIVIQGWTLYYEIFFYVIFGCSLYFFKPTYSLAFTAVLFIILVGAGANISNKTAALTIYTNPLLFEFLFGGMIASIYVTGFRLSIIKSLALIFFGFLFYGVLSYFSTPIHSSWMRVTKWGIPTAFVMAGFIFLEAATHQKNIWKSKIGDWLGNISYSIYLTHYAIFVFACTPAIMEWSRNGKNMGLFVLSGYLLAITIITSSVLYLFIEKPIAKISHQRVRRIKFT